MSYSVRSIRVFEKQARRLARKYPSLKHDLGELVRQLEAQPALGTLIGKNCYKIRLAITSKGQGKSGGARLITHLAVRHDTVYLLSIYDKSEYATVSDRELAELLAHIPGRGRDVSSLTVSGRRR